MDDPHKESNGHVNAALDMDNEFIPPKSNNNRKHVLAESSKNNPAAAAVVFEDLPYEPNFVMDKIENFWLSFGQLFNENEKYQKVVKIFGLVLLVVLYNCYFFGAVSYYVQYKVSFIFSILGNGKAYA